MRRYDWAAQMFAVIDAHQDSEFAWGVNDCCLFAARVVDAMCGTAHEKTLSEKYNDEASALAYIKESGGIAAAVDTFIGPHKTQGRPARGDVVLFNGANGETLGICVGEYIAAIAENGIVLSNRLLVICYWSI
jgi:NAD(P)H-hydrate repair Nnr-like enzyme with NAD(P)H-hydrate epimerase domain